MFSIVDMLLYLFMTMSHKYNYIIVVNISFLGSSLHLNRVLFKLIYLLSSKY